MIESIINELSSCGLLSKEFNEYPNFSIILDNCKDIEINGIIICVYNILFDGEFIKINDGVVVVSLNNIITFNVLLY